jgi:hypothetical protein
VLIKGLPQAPGKPYGVIFRLDFSFHTWEHDYRQLIASSNPIVVKKTTGNQPAP